MSINNDDIPPQSSYPYYWSEGSESSIDEFVTKYRPSMVQNDGTKPWLWVEGSESKFYSDVGREPATLEAIDLLKGCTAKIENIKTNKSIPLRSNKKSGAISKRELREWLQKEATEELKRIAIKHNYFTGKWLIFAPADKVDTIWATLAGSLVSGPLASSSARLAKVSINPDTETSHYRHVIYLYIPNVYDKNDVTAVRISLDI
ncbi:hypothetical protein AX15_006766 [Amanita polypyramis BW_CC]|nr:hypothetical protein AX15_006766 [Amanita polypyramis BW_CC]